METFSIVPLSLSRSTTQRDVNIVKVERTLAYYRQKNASYIYHTALSLGRLLQERTNALNNYGNSSSDFKTRHGVKNYNLLLKIRILLFYNFKIKVQIVRKI